MKSNQVHSAIISSQSSFLIANNHWLADFAFRLRPTYNIPHSFTLTESVLPAEDARVIIHEKKRLHEASTYTWLVDGWEDLSKRDLHASMAQQRSSAGILVNLEDSTGTRVDGKELLCIHERALDAMELENMDNFVAIVTDNPNLMKKYRRLAVQKWPRLLVSVPVFF
jgi:hypothetical protein